MGTRVYLALAALVAAFVVGATMFSMLPKPTSFGLPSANISVNLPASVPYRQVTAGAWDDLWPAWSPDGKTIAYVSDKGGADSVWVMNASGLNARQVTPTSTLATHLTWSPDSSKIAYWSMDDQATQFRLIDLSNGATTVVAGGGPNAIQGPAQWSPDGRRLLFFLRGTNPLLVSYDVVSGNLTSVASAPGDAPTAAWLSSSVVIYTTMEENASYIMRTDLTSDNTTVFAGDGHWNYTSPSASSTGAAAYYSNWMPDVYPSYMVFGNGYDVWVTRPENASGQWQFKMVPDVYQSQNLVAVPFLPGAVDKGESPVWNPNGTKVIYSSTTAEAGYHMYVWDTVNLTTVSVGPQLAVVCDAFEPSWSADGNSIAFSTNIGGFFHIWVTSASGTGTSVSSGGY